MAVALVAGPNKRHRRDGETDGGDGRLFSDISDSDSLLEMEGDRHSIRKIDGLLGK